MKTHSLCGRLFPQRRLFFVYFDPVRTFKVRTEEGVTRGTPLVGFFGSFLVRTRNEHIHKFKDQFTAYFSAKEIGTFHRFTQKSQKNTEKSFLLLCKMRACS